MSDCECPLRDVAPLTHHEPGACPSKARVLVHRFDKRTKAETTLNLCHCCTLSGDRYEVVVATDPAADARHEGETPCA